MPDAAVAAVVLAYHTAATGAAGLQRGVVTGNRVAVVFLGLAHHALGHGRNLLHKGVACELAFFHLRQLVFPFTGQLGFGEFLNPQAAQQRHQLKGLGRGNQFAAFAQHVFLGNQALDDARARGGRAQAFFLHGFAQLVVFHGFARAFHGAQERGF